MIDNVFVTNAGYFSGLSVEPQEKVATAWGEVKQASGNKFNEKGW